MNGERAKLRRKQLGLSGETIAKALNTTRVTVSRWEAGVSEPDDKTKIALAKLLNTSVAYLMDEADTPERSTPSLVPEIDTPPRTVSHAYWGEVIDNARDIGISGDKDTIAYVSQMLKRALSLVNVSVKAKDTILPDMDKPSVTNMPLIVGDNNESNLTLAPA